eukprot:455931_1
MLDLSIASPPTKAGKCFTIQHHPYKLNELCVNNIPYNYNESQVLQIFNKYKSIKIISFINQIKTLHNRPCKIAVIQTSSGYVASQILQEMNNHEIYSYGRNKHVLSIRYNRIQSCGFNYCFHTSFDAFLTKYACDMGVDLDLISNWDEYTVPYSDFNKFISYVHPPKKLKLKLKLNKSKYKNNSNIQNVENSNRKRKLNLNQSDIPSNPTKKTKPNPTIQNNKTRDTNANTNTNTNTSSNNTNTDNNSRNINNYHTINTNTNSNTNNSDTSSNTNTNTQTNCPISLINPESIEMPTFGHVATSKLLIKPFECQLLQSFENRKTLDKNYRTTITNICRDYGEDADTVDSHIRRVTKREKCNNTNLDSITFLNFDHFRHLTPSSVENNTTCVNYPLQSTKDITTKFAHEYKNHFNWNEGHLFMCGVTGKQHYPKKSQISKDSKGNIATFDTINSNINIEPCYSHLFPAIASTKIATRPVFTSEPSTICKATSKQKPKQKSKQKHKSKPKPKQKYKSNQTIPLRRSPRLKLKQDRLKLQQQ